jgi:hypothetical protein
MPPLILTKLLFVPTESNPIRLYSFGFTMEGRLIMKAKKKAAKKPAKKAAKKKKR